MKERIRRISEESCRGIRRMLLVFGIVMTGVTVTSCSDEPVIINPDSELEETEDGHVTSFSLESGRFNLTEEETDLNVTMMGIGIEGDVRTYSCRAERQGDVTRFHLEIPREETIANGSYVMTLARPTGISLPGRLKVTFADGRLAGAEMLTANYPLRGSGTTEDPYTIGSEEDFKAFSAAVKGDSETHGAGLVFQQTADLQPPLENDVEGYLIDVFAGIYDGWGKTIVLTLKSIKGAAMFGTLTGSGSVSNLTFSNASISSEKDYSAVVAGRVTGNVSFSNLVLTGVVAGDNYVGALAGHINGGNVTMSHVEVSVTVSGHGAYAGGLAGKIENTKNVLIKDCRVSSPVEGGQYVGGAFGDVYLTSSSLDFEVNGLEISYPFSGRGVKGGDNVGGFAGRWHCEKNNKLTTSQPIEVMMSVEGTQSNTGGLFGLLEDAEIDIDLFAIGSAGSTYQPNVRGVENVGGIAGKMSNSDLYGWQYFDFEQNGKGLMTVPSQDKFRSSFSGMVKGLKNVGGLVGSMVSSSLRHISGKAQIEMKGENIGGLVGSFETAGTADDIEDCTFGGQINAGSSENVGGIVGYYVSKQGGVIKDCINYSPISGGYYTGGIVGYLRKEHDYNDGAQNKMSIDLCVNMGSVMGSYNVGGIIGRTYSKDTKIGQNYIIDSEIDVTNCMNAGSVTALGGNSEEALGGIAGRTGALTLVKLCANHGFIEGRGKLHAIGGIVGRMGQDPTGGESYCYNTFAEECINTAAINSTHRDARVGGIAGYGEEGGEGYGHIYLGGIVNCRNSGKIEPDQKDDTGGLLGYADNWIFIFSNFNNGKVMHGNALLGTQKALGHQCWGYNYTLSGCGGSWPLDFTFILSSSEVTDEKNFNGFDFETIWEMGSDGPNLRNNKWRDPASACRF